MRSLSFVLPATGGSLVGCVWCSMGTFVCISAERAGRSEGAHLPQFVFLFGWKKAGSGFPRCKKYNFLLICR